MPVITNATTLAALGGAIQQEKLDQLHMASRENHIYRAIAYQKGPAEVGGAKTYKFPYINSSAAAVDIPDGEDIPATQVTGGGNVATMGEVAHLTPLTSSPQLASPESVAALVEDGMGSVAETIDTRVLGLFTSATNNSDFSGADLDKAKLVQIRRDWKKQKPGRGTYAGVLHPDQWANIETSIMTTAGSTHIDSTGWWNGLFTAETGYKGFWGGIHWFESSNVPQEDATNWCGAIVKIPGPGAPMGALGLAVWQGMSMDVRKIQNATANNLIFYANLGVQIVQQTWIRKIISQKAA